MKTRITGCTKLIKKILLMSLIIVNFLGCSISKGDLKAELKLTPEDVQILSELVQAYKAFQEEKRGSRND